MIDSFVGKTGSLRLFALSVVCGLTVSVTYIPQALLTGIAGDLGISHGVASVLATVIQIGYAVGILMLVPLAARLEVKKQVTYQTLALTGTMLMAAVAPNIVGAMVAFLAVGLVANISQVLIPAANRMSAHDRRGATNSVLVGSLLVGIFGGRLLASLCCEWIGWRATVCVFALAVLATIPATRWALRHAPAPEDVASSHFQLVLGTVQHAASNPILVRSALTQACVFATFNAVWTVMALHLTGPGLAWTLSQAGLFGMVGMVAGFFTPYAGRLIDRFGAARMTGWFLFLLLAAMVGVLLTNSTPVAFGIVMFVATWANQSALSGNQVRALATDPQQSAQLNTGFGFIVFLVGGTGSLLGPSIYAWQGIDAVATASVVLIILAIAQWWLIPCKPADQSPVPTTDGIPAVNQPDRTLTTEPA
ncbi:MFS transporter [Mycobacterium sp. SMC-4]|uniref:MFS transporter n=1 Tax=Mycobacterium sp. SMC-4 TaxID=2857059 RepID=UPI003D058BE7